MSNVTAWWTKAALVLTLAQLAQDGLAQPGAPVRRSVSLQTIEQKISMLEKLLGQSSVAARVLASGSEQAQRHLGAARELAVRARSLSTAGELPRADALLNEAIWEIGRAQQLVPDSGLRQAGDRARYLQLEDSVAALRRTSEIGPSATAAGEPVAGVVAQADGHVQRAVSLAAAERYSEANQQLDLALMLLMKDASARLAGQTLVYGPRFANRREEFDHELERHRSFERLVPLALAELRPAPDAVAVVQRHVARARELRERGEALAGRDLAAAIGHVVDGTYALRNALQASGLVVPQTMGSQ
jgi:hypothetical protein